MSARAIIRDSLMMPGVDVALVLYSNEQGSAAIQWGNPLTQFTPAGEAPDDLGTWLHLPDDAGRALYEALARHFGGDAVDARRLRADYDAERKRVDLFIAFLTGPS